MKSEFIISELWVLSIAGAFQRANIYAPNSLSASKKAFKKDLKIYLEQLIKAQYYNEVNEQSHIDNIHALSEYSKKFATLLRNGKLNFGVSQKILNLFLKYIWCLKLIPMPPQFPVDRIIQVVLNIKAKEKGLKTRQIVAWTKLDNENNYVEIIEFAKKIKNADTKYATLSLAEMELVLFNRP